MNWSKLGLITLPVREPWALSHAMIPTPYLSRSGALRIYYSACDSEGRGRPSFLEVDSLSPTRVIRQPGPLLELGRPGCFDDNGVVVTSVLRGRGDEVLMYYVGFELCRGVRYRLFTGLAISVDDGLTFHRYAEVPVLDRSEGEAYFRCGPFVDFDGARFAMWYIGGNQWTEVAGKHVPVYDLRYVESPDGRTWPDAGRVVMELSDPDEHGFGRPWLLRSETGWELFYSVRRRSLGAYRLGYASSTDGLAFTRRDAELGLDVSHAGFDSQAIMYLATVETPSGVLGFYNGNDFGREGIGVARRKR
ncbi:MAG: hypothetical protein IT380_30385 [Myxococcales bacterium]|nr:hypothetical protein [Myxococcales bacterium]